MTVHYRVVHRTRYEYESDVSASYGELHLLPRNGGGQRCREASVVIDPAPDEYRTWDDFFGNRAGYFSIQGPHRALEVTTTSLVEVDPPSSRPADARPWEETVRRLRQPIRRRRVNIMPGDRDPTPDGGPWGDGAADGAGEDGDVIDARQYVLSSPMVEPAAMLVDYAGGSFSPGRPLLDAAVDLGTRIYRDFEYKPGATSVTTTLTDLFDKKAGVCQDFAHLAIGCLRSLGLAARYVSGYLDTDPPAGRPKRRAADVSHAWFSLFVPGAGWVDVDPTNNRLVNDRYVVTAWGRDYTDVPPLKGVIYTEGKTTALDVSVDVLVVDGVRSG